MSIPLTFLAEFDTWKKARTMTTNQPSFITLPAEIRQAIYSHLLHDLQIQTGQKLNLLNTSAYPYQITATSRLVRSETTPYFRRGKTELICHDGRLPDSVRRRIPRRVLHDISRIVIVDKIAIDEIQPSLRTFPRLQTLEFDVVSYKGFRDYGMPWQSAELRSLKYAIENVLMIFYMQMTMPREGLERDYLPEATLWEVMSMPRAKRGFDIIATRRLWEDQEDHEDPSLAKVVKFVFD